MTSVFISYQRKPSAMLATLIARELRERGIEVYLDTQRMDSAGVFPERLKDGIRNSDVFVCLVGASTFESEWVQEEIRTALEYDRPMIPVLQESYQQGQPAPTPAVKKLLEHDGILVFDVKNVYIDQSIDALARMIENTAAQARASGQAATPATAAPNLNPADLAGRTLGPYQLRELLGTGGMGAVYRAYQASLNRDVALKVISPALSSDEGYARRFVREAQTAAALEHPHIVPVYDYGSNQGFNYVVMRLLTGGSLADRMAYQKATGSPLPSLAEAADVIQKLAAALDYAHSRGVIHRDIKANNVMFDDHGTPFLVDFGIAKLTGASTSLTHTGMVMGTPSYMAPEQWRGESVTAATDQYALGVLAYGLLTGHMPFEASTPFALMHQHLNDVPPPPDTWRADVPAGLQAVIDRAMAKEAADRYPSIRDFAQSFAEAIGGDGGQMTGFFTLPLPQKAPQPVTISEPARPTAVPPDHAPIASADQSTATASPPGRALQSPVTWGVAIGVFIIGAVIIGLIGTQPGGFLAAAPTATPTATATLTQTPTPTPTATPAVPIASARRGLTVRAGPGSQYAALTTLAAGADVIITGISEDGSWYQVELEDGTLGWLTAAAASVQTAGDVDAVPVAAAPTQTPTETPASTDTPVPTVTPTATDTPLPTDTPAASATPTHTEVPTDTPTPDATETPVPTSTPAPPTQPPDNVMLLYDNVSFTLHNRAGRTLSLEGVIFRSSSGNWNARSWGVSLYTSVPDNNCLRLRNAASGQRQPPPVCGNLYGLQLVGTTALFWLNVDQFDVVRSGEVIATCRADAGQCPVYIPAD